MSEHAGGQHQRRRTRGQAINGETAVNRVKGLPTGPHQIPSNEGTWFEFRNILINLTN
ncbi:MAG: hypothetical protein R3F11_06625 [Verrucomicrobiales bacterium]